MIACTVKEGCFIVFMKDGVEVYDINMNLIANDNEVDMKIKEMSMKNWVDPSMLDHIEKTMRQYLRRAVVA